MAQLVAMYKHPQDIEAFDKHYREKHLRIAKCLPGLRKYEASRTVLPAATTAAQGGELRRLDPVELSQIDEIQAEADAETMENADCKRLWRVHSGVSAHLCAG